MFPPRPDQMTEQPVPYAPGPRTGVPVQANALVTSGLALDTSVQAGNTTLAAVQAGIAATNTQLATGVPPAVSNYQSGSKILQAPGLYTIFTFSGAGRIWGATVSFAMGSSGGTGSNQGYARVLVQSGADLAIVECCVVGNPSADSNTSDKVYNGLAVPNGTVVQLDVNNGGMITGVVLRASGLVGVSIP